MKCKMNYFWRSERENSLFVAMHHHQCYELVYYKIGSGISQIGTEAIEFTENSIAFIQPETEHNEIHWTNNDIFCIGFEIKNSSDINLKSSIYSLKNDKTIGKLILEIAKEVREQHINYQLMISLKITEILLLLSRMQKSPQRNYKNINYIINYLNENYDQKINLSEIAEIYGYSYSHFRHQFKEKTGLSPQSYLVQRRLIEAKKMLENSELNLTEIAAYCGFSTSAQFSSMFKKEYGVSPLKLRKKEY